MRFLIVLLLIQVKAFASTFYKIDEARSYQPYFYNVTQGSGNDISIAAHLWSNNQTKLVVMAHGYTDNCGYLKPIQRWYLQKGFDVVCLELPGHGESGGNRADVERIETYLEIYEQVLPQIYALKYNEFIFYGHSTGNVGMIEYLLNGNSHQFKSMVMGTPLIRSFLWKLSRFGHDTLGRYVRRLPKRPVSTSNPEYHKLEKLDPKPFRSVPLHWYSKLIEWNDKLESDSRVSNEKFTIIFGSRDTVIDYNFNRSFMEEKFPEAKIEVITGSDHTLHYQEKIHTDQFYSILEKNL